MSEGWEQLPLFGEHAPPEPDPRGPGIDPRVPVRKWSGPIPGQTVLPPRGGDLESILPSGEPGPLGTDKHGNYDEYEGVHPWDELGDIESAYSQGPSLRGLAKQQPVQMMRTDTPVHTLQGTGETEQLYDVVHGSERRQKLESDIAHEGVRQPLLVVHHQGRHILLDGHHRLLAARKAGHTHVPAQVFDHDAHVRRGGTSLISPDEIDFGDDLDFDGDIDGYGSSPGSPW